MQKNNNRAISKLNAANRCKYTISIHSDIDYKKNGTILSIWTKDNRILVKAPKRFWRWYL